MTTIKLYTVDAGAVAAPRRQSARAVRPPSSGIATTASNSVPDAVPGIHHAGNVPATEPPGTITSRRQRHRSP
jgi:hypothetical protein